MENLNINDFKTMSELGKLKREKPKEYEEMFNDFKIIVKDLFKVVYEVQNELS
jgi:hypothetical protein